MNSNIIPIAPGLECHIAPLFILKLVRGILKYSNSKMEWIPNVIQNDLTPTLFYLKLKKSFHLLS